MKMIPLTGDADAGVAFTKTFRSNFLWNEAAHQRNFWRRISFMAAAVLAGGFLLMTPATGSAAQVALTLAASNTTATSAVLVSSINPEGLATTASFQYGATTNYGTTTFAAPVGAGTAAIIFTHAVTGLTPGAVYHYRIVTTSSAGAVNGADVAFTASVLSPVATGLPGIGHGAVAVGDFDNDGKLDLLLTGEDTNFLGLSQLWRNGGANVFANTGATIPAVSSSAVAWGDLYNDGNQDVVVSGFAGTDVNHFPILMTQIWRNTGGGNFAKLNVTLPGLDTGTISLADYDNDGRLDIMLTGFSGSGPVTQFWHNLGNGNFVTVSNAVPAVFYSAVAWADFDGDGNEDFVIAGTTNGLNDSLCQVWKNLGSGNFTNINAGLPGVSQGAVAWGDFDNDGKLDLVITGYSTNGPIGQVWRNLGNGKFSNLNVGLTGVSQSAVAVGDFDNDGKLDIALTGLNSNNVAIAQVWRNLGNGVFTNINAGLAGVSLGTAAWVDADNDGRLDLLLTGFDTNNNSTLTLYHNSSAQVNTNGLKISGVTQLTNGFPRVAFKAPDGFSYRVQGTSDLQTWTKLGAAVSAGGGVQEFSEVGQTNRVRFYRVSTP